jgi:5-hydroxyisourate hydrolase
MAGQMKRISTHILDIARGMPTSDVPVRLEWQEKSGDWRLLASARTDRDGRCANLLHEDATLVAGVYRLNFDTASYYAAQKVEGLYPVIHITFEVRDGESHVHIPLLLAPNGYTTYRGS